MDGIVGSIYRTNERNIKDGAHALSGIAGLKAE